MNKKLRLVGIVLTSLGIILDVLDCLDDKRYVKHGISFLLGSATLLIFIFNRSEKSSWITVATNIQGEK